MPSKGESGSRREDGGGRIDYARPGGVCSCCSEYCDEIVSQCGDCFRADRVEYEKHLKRCRKPGAVHRRSDERSYAARIRAAAKVASVA